MKRKTSKSRAREFSISSAELSRFGIGGNEQSSQSGEFCQKKQNYHQIRTRIAPIYCVMGGVLFSFFQCHKFSKMTSFLKLCPDAKPPL